MPTPLNNENEELAIFDSYVKSVLRNACMNMKRNEEKRKSLISNDSGSYETVLDIHGLEDTKFSKNIIFDEHGYQCQLSDIHLYDAMLLLTKKQTTVLIMEFWYGFRVGEIAKELHISERAVRLRRENAFRIIRENLGDCKIER